MTDRGRLPDEQDFEEFLKEAIEAFDEFNEAESFGKSGKKGGVSYLEPMPNHRGEGDRGAGLDYDQIGATLGKKEKALYITQDYVLR